MSADYSNVAERAMLVRLSISTWSGRKFDKQVTAETNRQHEADARAARVNKDLMVGAVELQRVISAAGAARAEHYAQTLPWSDEGWALLPTENYLAYTKAMRVRFAEMDLALVAFYDAYPRLVAEGKRKQGKMAKDGDYPKVEDIRSRFGRSIEISPVPSAGDLRVDLPADRIKAIEAGITARVEGAVKEAMDDAWRRLYEAVSHIKAKLSEDKPRIYDTLITNAEAIVEVLARLNVSGDEKLEKMRRQVERELAGIDPDDLRGDGEGARKMRKATAAKAQAIVDAMAAFYAPQT